MDTFFSNSGSISIFMAVVKKTWSVSSYPYDRLFVTVSHSRNLLPYALKSGTLNYPGQLNPLKKWLKMMDVKNDIIAVDVKNVEVERTLTPVKK